MNVRKTATAVAITAAMLFTGVTTAEALDLNLKLGDDISETANVNANSNASENDNAANTAVTKNDNATDTDKNAANENATNTTDEKNETKQADNANKTVETKSEDDQTENNQQSDIRNYTFSGHLLHKDKTFPDNYEWQDNENSQNLRINGELDQTHYLPSLNDEWQKIDEETATYDLGSGNSNTVYDEDGNVAITNLVKDMYANTTSAYHYDTHMKPQVQVTFRRTDYQDDWTQPGWVGNDPGYYLPWTLTYDEKTGEFEWVNDYITEWIDYENFENIDYLPAPPYGEAKNGNLDITLSYGRMAYIVDDKGNLTTAYEPESNYELSVFPVLETVKSDMAYGNDTSIFNRIKLDDDSQLMKVLKQNGIDIDAILNAQELNEAWGTRYITYNQLVEKTGGKVYIPDGLTSWQLNRLQSIVFIKQEGDLKGEIKEATYIYWFAGSFSDIATVPSIFIKTPRQPEKQETPKVVEKTVTKVIERTPEQPKQETKETPKQPMFQTGIDTTGAATMLGGGSVLTAGVAYVLRKAKKKVSDR